ncbi:hypothetical protein LWF15_15055 [Kineosporia rhizophila]|uniref:hypothetical protein n=1 Tax=Kineosporia TaxID=49184 RepID=UPI001E33008D|nr:MULTISPECIES: hypothetical protein [Kineosporia]MCE0536824.1 hypothetical protein [Kineosporia rhizophila]
MNTMTIEMRSTTVTTASGNPFMGSPLGVGRYRVGVTLQPSLGGVCLLAATGWDRARSGFAAAEAGRPTTVRPNSDFSKPRYGSLASDGSG